MQHAAYSSTGVPLVLADSPTRRTFRLLECCIKLLPENNIELLLEILCNLVGLVAGNKPRQLRRVFDSEFHIGVGLVGRVRRARHRVKHERVAANGDAVSRS